MSKYNKETLIKAINELVQSGTVYESSKDLFIAELNKHLPTGENKLTKVSQVYNTICQVLMSETELIKAGMIKDGETKAKSWTTLNKDGLTKDWTGNAKKVNQLVVSVKNRIFRACNGLVGALNDKGQIELIASGVKSVSTAPVFKRAKFVNSLSSQLAIMIEQSDEFSENEIDQATALLEALADPQDAKVDTIECPAKLGIFGETWDDLKACSECASNAECKETLVASRAA